LDKLLFCFCGLLGDKVLEDAVDDRLLIRLRNCSCRSQKETDDDPFQPNKPSKDRNVGLQSKPRPQTVKTVLDSQRRRVI